MGIRYKIDPQTSKRGASVSRVRFTVRWKFPGWSTRSIRDVQRCQDVESPKVNDFDTSLSVFRVYGRTQMVMVVGDPSGFKADCSYSESAHS